MIDARVRKRGPNGFELDVHWKSESKSIALLGPSGAGKTLLLECLSGFVRPDEGRVAIGDDVVFDGAGRIFVPPEKRAVAYVPSQDSLLDHLTVRENLALAVASGGRLEKRRKVDVMLDEAGLARYAARRPAALTRGERLRASVARALLASPRVLVIDEPERGLDAALCEELRAAVDAASEGRNVQVVLAGRDPEAWLELATEAVILHHGKLLRHGAADDLLDEPLSPDVARLLGRHSIMEAEIMAIDPARKLSRLRCGADAENAFEIVAPYFPGLMKGAHVQIALRTDRVTAATRGEDGIPRTLDHAVEGLKSVALHFDGGVVAEITRREWEPHKHNKSWMVTVPPEAVRLLR